MGNSMSEAGKDTNADGIAMEKVDKVLQVVKLDGKIIEFDAPIKVKDLLKMYSDVYYIGAFPGATEPLPLDYKLEMGRNYYLLPYDELHDPPPRKLDQGNHGRVKMVKLVVTKQQLQHLLSKGIRVQDFLFELDKETRGCANHMPGAWKPTLEAIPE